MPALRFPTDRIVGTLSWKGSWSDEHGPVLATGSVEVPDGVAVSMEVQLLLGSEPSGRGSWSMIPAQEAVDLGFVRDLPADAVESLSIPSAHEESFAAVAHLAPGLRRLYLGYSRFSDAVLPTVAMLTELTFLQTFGNVFTDHGVQQLVSLVKVDHLYLEEETLTVRAFDFVDRLPQLTRLGVRDVPLTEHEIARLRERLPGVDVG